MQISLRCKFCQKMTVSESDSDLCLEIDAHDEELRFICRSCKKENKLKLTNNAKTLPLPKTSISRY